MKACQGAASPALLDAGTAFPSDYFNPSCQPLFGSQDACWLPDFQVKQARNGTFTYTALFDWRGQSFSLKRQLETCGTANVSIDLSRRHQPLPGYVETTDKSQAQPLNLSQI